MSRGSGDRGIGGSHRLRLILLVFSIPLSLNPPIPLLAQGSASSAQLQSGQELIYSGHFGAAQVYFSDIAQQFPRDPAGPALEASALIWWGEAQSNEGFQVAAIDSLLGDAIARAQAADSNAAADSSRLPALFWLGTAYGYRARQAEMRGFAWRAARDAHAMQGALERALAIDSSYTDCLLGLGIYDYALARASTVARLVAHIIGLGSGDVERALGRLRRASEGGVLTRTEARWVYANALLREGDRDAAQREAGIRAIAALAEQFPENPVFRRPIPAPADP